MDYERPIKIQKDKIRYIPCNVIQIICPSIESLTIERISNSMKMSSL